MTLRHEQNNLPYGLLSSQSHTTLRDVELSTGFATTCHKQFRTAGILAFVALLSSLPAVPLATAQLAANPSSHAVASLHTSGATRTSTRVVAKITGALSEPNDQVVSNMAFTLNFAVETIQDGFTGVNASWKSNSAYSQTMNVWFVAYDSKNHVVFLSFAQLRFAAQESNAVFQTFSSALPSGTYVVRTFVVTPSGTAFSITASVTISF